MSITAGGDIIVAVDDESVQSMDDLIVYLADRAVGQTVTLTLVRDQEEQLVSVTLQERPERER